MPIIHNTAYRNKPFIRFRLIPALLFAMLMAMPGIGNAYIGPGLGVAAIWILLGPIAALVILVAIIAYYPLRYYYKKYIQYRNRDGAQDTTPDDTGNDDDNSHGDS